MIEFFSKLFSSEFMPHGHCYLWQPEILWLHVVSDATIAIAYYSIPVALLYFVRRRTDLAFNWIFVLFAAFIFACGSTHLLEIWTVWQGSYRIQGVVKLATAIVSVATAIILWPLIPQALRIPSRKDLEEAYENLEELVQARTKQLDEANSLL
ncbi:MAG: hypothetical protein KDD70_01310, partial [Bdellovibrionales bacterium]|nr:hypothetical protein [Bdellovibrionales bacterium]